MAGIGKRMRPHTITTPKPLIPVAGIPIVERLVTDIASMLVSEKVEELAFIIGDFGKEVENELVTLSRRLGYTCRIYYQQEALGTAHALYCAKESLKGKILIGYADTLFYTTTKMKTSEEGIIWVKKIEDPTLFGVVKHDNAGYITEFAEKSKKFVSDLAIIGLYYFREGERLREEIKSLIDNDIKGNGEYQITDALDNMKTKGCRIKVFEVEKWFDCGNKDATVHTNQEILKLNNDKNLISDTVEKINSVIIPPSFIAEKVKLKNSIIGPYVSIGQNTVIEHSVISNSIVLNSSHIKNANIDNSIIGNYVKYTGQISDLSIGDYTEIGL